MQVIRTLEYRGFHGYPLDDHGRVDRLNCLDRHLPLGEVEEASRNGRHDRKQVELRVAFLSVHQRGASHANVRAHALRIECRMKHPLSDTRRRGRVRVWL
jgi:hypothetical protein